MKGAWFECKCRLRFSFKYWKYSSAVRGTRQWLLPIVVQFRPSFCFPNENKNSNLVNRGTEKQNYRNLDTCESESSKVLEMNVCNNLENNRKRQRSPSCAAKSSVMIAVGNCRARAIHVWSKSNRREIDFHEEFSNEFVDCWLHNWAIDNRRSTKTEGPSVFLPIDDTRRFLCRNDENATKRTEFDRLFLWLDNRPSDIFDQRKKIFDKSSGKISTLKITRSSTKLRRFRCFRIEEDLWRDRNQFQRDFSETKCRQSDNLKNEKQNSTNRQIDEISPSGFVYFPVKKIFFMNLWSRSSSGPLMLIEISNRRRNVEFSTRNNWKGDFSSHELRRFSSWKISGNRLVRTETIRKLTTIIRTGFDFGIGIFFGIDRFGKSNNEKNKKNRDKFHIEFRSSFCVQWNSKSFHESSSSNRLVGFDRRITKEKTIFLENLSLRSSRSFSSKKKLFPRRFNEKDKRFVRVFRSISTTPVTAHWQMTNP